MTPSRLPLLGVLAVGALALAGCAGGGAEPSSPAPSSASSSASPTTTAASSASTSPAASASASSTPTATALSLDLPEELSGESATRLRAVVQDAAGPAAELGQTFSSPLERKAALEEDAAIVDALEEDAGDDAGRRACVDATRTAREADQASGAAEAAWYAQPQTASTTGGSTDGTAASGRPGLQVEPLGVQVAVYPDEATARSVAEAARDAAEACEGQEMSSMGVSSVEPLTGAPGETAFTVVPVSGSIIYAVSTVVQVGDRVYAVSQGEDGAGVPEGAEERAVALVEDLEAALEG